jgi:hypothetical protein
VFGAPGWVADGSVGVAGEGGRRFELVSRLADRADASPVAMLERASVLGPGWCGVSGMAVSLLNDHGPGLVVCASGPVAAALEGLQSSLGEGPGLKAHGDGAAVLVGDVAASTLWVQYSQAAVQAGAAAVFGFALHIGAARFGAMTLHRDRRGDLGSEGLRDAVVLSEIVTSLVLALQANGDVWSDGDLDDLDAGWLVIHQATGMVSAQLDVAVDAALARLRAHAYGAGRSLGEVAADVVARRLRLDGDGP